MDGIEDVARRLIAVREERSLTQVEMAAELHVAKNTLNGYERGTRQLTLETAKRIRERFGISIDWLLYGDVGQPGYEIASKLGPRPELESEKKKGNKVKKRRSA